MHGAANNDNPAVIAALLDGGADPNARDGDGLSTPAPGGIGQSTISP